MAPENQVKFLRRGQKWPYDEERLKRYVHNEALFKGDQDSVYRQEFLRRMLRKEEQTVVEVIANFPGAVTKLFTDLLFGERPSFICEEEDTLKQDWVDSFIDYNKLHRQNIKAALAQSYRGDAVYKLRIKEGELHAKVDVIPAKYWFPIIDETSITEKNGDVIAYEVKRGEGTSEVKFIVAEIHYPGKIINQVWRLTNGKLDSLVPLEEFFDDPPDEEVDTGVDRSLIFVVPNMELDDSHFGIDDYEEADTLFRELSVRLSQPSRILDKHSDPNMYGPPMIGEDGEDRFKAGGTYFALEDDEKPPGYLAWDGQLEANWKYIEQIMKQLYIVTDTNEAAFSLLLGGNVPSGTAMKRLMMRPLARTNRKREFFNDALVELIEVAAEFERANGFSNVPEGVTVEIEWQDGLPNDEKENAEIEAIRTGSKPTSSIKSAIRRLDGGSEQSIQDELDAISEDESMAEQPVALPGSMNFAGFGEFGGAEEEDAED